MTKPTRHRTGRGNPSVRLDPYALDETTITLAEWRRRTRPPRPRRAAQPRAVRRRAA